MIKINKTIFVIMFVLSLSSIIFCQDDVTGAITSLVGRNAEGYLAPLGTMMGGGMNSGFYRKASPHKILGFDITFDFAYSMAPAGQTTYTFYVPDGPGDTISFPFQFEFPKTLLTNDIQFLNAIPSAGTSNSGEDLYQDISLPFSLKVTDLLDVKEGTEAQNILGKDEPILLTVTLDSALLNISDQALTHTWNTAEGIPGIGTEYVVKDPSTGIILTTLQPLYSNKEEFKEKYGAPLDSLIRSQLGQIDMPTLPIPGGFEDLPLFQYLRGVGLDAGFPTPIFQASVGLPFHTEITARGLPVPMSLGSITFKYGGFGGKIGISEYLSDILYKPVQDVPEFSDSNLVYLIETPPSKINPSDVENAISDLRLNEINVNELDSLNYLLIQGNTIVVVEIQNKIRDAQLQLEKQAKKKKNKKFPVDLSLGYYTNDLKLDFSGAAINSTNRMFSLQAGKTLNLPSFLAFLGGIGIYGGLGFESSDLNLGYELANPLAYGCFSSSGTYKENITEEECTGSKTWTTGVPTDISLSFPGNNTFRSLIGARMRILFADAYVDYNMGNSNNSINAGFGITFR